MPQTDCKYYSPIGGTECGYRNSKGVFCFNIKVAEFGCPFLEEVVELENKIEPDSVDGRRLEPLS